MTQDVIITPAHEGADGGGRSIEDGDAVAIDHLPEPVGLGLVGRTFVKEDRRAIRKQTVNNITVAGDPADVSGAEITVGLLEIENIVAAQLGTKQVARTRVKDALRFASGAGCVENEKRVLGVEGFRLMLVGRAIPSFLPPDIATLNHANRCAGPLDNDDCLNGRRIVERLVHVGLELDDLAAPPAAVGGNNELGLAVVKPVLDSFGTKATEDHRVNRTDAGAGQHRNDRLGDHRQVERHAIAGTHTHVFKNMRETAYVEMQLFVSNRADIARLAFEDQCSLVLARGAKMAVETVLRDVQFATGEPLRMRGVPLEDFFERLAPYEQLFGLPLPEFFWAIDRFIIQLFISGITPKVCLALKLGRRLKDSLIAGN